ncbi:prophage antirepressor [Acetobacter pasteurianus NBRC 3280]|uniref:Prophage antirepressor n=1 Tax=Acetobacter pasteurianus NBRC 3278 TaxID=1226660 RepID=A0A401X8L0_ACEPA|nr:Bro-N domain-containing protein [Acetobacter pasteurianus]GCD60236.1 prophage antirepressor [Acetobacter pasteurianus NBRC 3277]GCD64048.1 prophage antirepressor [Acetobacter pasteurianus NBRC 3278]GCD70232.1 prophage antirepressor [Acetobacter pasteurianus NBRC 3280]
MNSKSTQRRQQQYKEPLVVKADSLRFEEQGLGTVSIHGNRWVLAKEICDVLGISNPRHAVTRLDDDEYMLVLLQTAGGPQEAYIVNESGAYHLTFIATKPVAKRFRRWVTDEVLPQIRRSGEYRPDAGVQADNGASKPEISADDLRLLAELKEGDIYQATRHLVTRMNGKFSVERALSEAKRPWSYDLDILELIHLVKLVQISWFALGQNSERSDQMRQYMCRLSAVMRLLDDKFGTGPYFEPVTSASPERS